MRHVLSALSVVLMWVGATLYRSLPGDDINVFLPSYWEFWSTLFSFALAGILAEEAGKLSVKKL